MSDQKNTVPTIEDIYTLMQSKNKCNEIFDTPEFEKSTEDFMNKYTPTAGDTTSSEAATMYSELVTICDIACKEGFKAGFDAAISLIAERGNL